MTVSIAPSLIMMIISGRNKLVKDIFNIFHQSRFKFTRLLQNQSFVFDKARFVVSVDPMRVVTVPNTLNGLTGLVCKYLGDRKEFEKLSITSLLDETRAFIKFHSYPEPLERRQTETRDLKSMGSIPV